MNSLRFLVVGVLFTLPLFAFAQTATTTETVEQPVTQENQPLKDPDQIAIDRLNLLRKIPDVRSSAISNLLDIKISPSNPGPNQTVRVSIESYLSDMNKATITWYLDGRVVSNGIGKKSFSFQNGATGKTTVLSVSILTNTGEYITKEFSWTPVGVTLFWEADTYTPPFYRGKPLLSPQARVMVVAVPDNTGGQNALSAGGLVYLWEKNGTVMSEYSGYGNNSFTLVGPKPYDETNVKVRVSSIDDTMGSEARVYLPLSNPFILFYDNNPILGALYNHPVGTTLDLSKKEFSLIAEPYFFSNERGNTPTLKYTWLVNGKDVQNYGRTITLRNETGSKGQSDVSISMRGTKQSFQTASRGVRVNFTEGTSSSRPIF